MLPEQSALSAHHSEIDVVVSNGVINPTSYLTMEDGYMLVTTIKDNDQPMWREGE